MYKFFYIIYIIIFFISTSSCSKINNLNGYLMKNTDFSLLRKNTSTKDDVYNIFGVPSIKYDIDDNSSTNIYFSQNISNFLFYRPTILERKVVVINYNKDIISSIEQYNLSNQKNISYYVDDNLSNHITNKTYFSEIFSNIGQVTPN